MLKVSRKMEWVRSLSRSEGARRAPRAQVPAVSILGHEKLIVQQRQKELHDRNRWGRKPFHLTGVRQVMTSELVLLCFN